MVAVVCRHGGAIVRNLGLIHCFYLTSRCIRGYVALDRAHGRLCHVGRRLRAAV